MKFKSTEYCYNLYLNASRKTDGEIHSNTWNLTAIIDVGALNVKPDAIYKKLEDSLEFYNNKVLNETVPFDVIEPELINIASYFAERFGAVAASFGCTLTEIRANDSVHTGIILKTA